MTYRDIVGDTSDWRRAHRREILRLVDPERLKQAKVIARAERRDVLDVLQQVPLEKGLYERRSPPRPILDGCPMDNSGSTGDMRIHLDRQWRPALKSRAWRTYDQTTLLLEIPWSAKQ